LINVDLPTPEAPAELRADRVHRRAGGDGSHLTDPCVEIVRKVGLVQHDHRARPAFPGHGEVTLDPPKVEVTIQTRHEERHIDVRSQNLLERFTAGDLA
jgi:hypothetical protein